MYTTLHIYSVYFLPLFLSRTFESKEFWRFSVGTGAKEDESSTWRVWAAWFYNVTACSRLSRVL
jgi:hypothetical protein